MTADEIYTEFVAEFSKRKFAAGLLIAFVELYKELGIPGSGTKSFADVIKRFPQQTKTATGATANTLIVQVEPGRTRSLRPFYNAAEFFFREKNSRFDYPSCAPHATQGWRDYARWLDALAVLPLEEIDSLKSRVETFVLDTLKDQSFDPKKIRKEPHLFRLLLEKFDLTRHRGEMTGAAYQGIVFGFLRADNPHLQIEIGKVRTGSKRLQRVSDIDGWDGEQLAISAEVKQYRLNETDVDHFKDFANEVKKRGAIGMVVGLSFGDGARDAIKKLGVEPVDRSDLLRIVGLWDPLKQRTAIASMTYYARHVEKSSVLGDRLDAFLQRAFDPKNRQAAGNNFPASITTRFNKERRGVWPRAGSAGAWPNAARFTCYTMRGVHQPAPELCLRCDEAARLRRLLAGFGIRMPRRRHTSHRV